ncbi:unnamed protein product [Pelagomonas calceolata]|uniref:Uncharacterized protein n=1 Tax=Pelagomonas calceolata TaxID=35677 RepID=A0A8J2SH52_9STRA|nr:unnamed protein product [Pelagomonas calceolata]
MASEEHRIRERLWTRAQVWREQHSPEKASAGCPTRRDLYHSPNIPRTTARPTPPAAPTPKKTPSPGFRDKPSGSLVRRLGLGRIDDRGAGLGKKGKTAFAAAYRGGEISRWLRVDQNGSYPVVVFAAAAADVPLGRALPLCFEGLSERCHPLCLLARRGTLMLLAEHPERAQVPALLPRLAGPLRAALADPDADVCGFALTVLAPLAELCGAALEQFLDRLLPPVARRCGGRGKLAAAALDALRRVEESCPGAGAKIRRKVPAYR